MPQLYPQPVSSTQGVTVRAGAGLFGGGPVALGQSVTISGETTRQQYTVSPATGDGANGSFTIQGPIPSGYVDVFVAGQLQVTSAYTLVGPQISFVIPPASGATVAAVYATPQDSRQQYTLVPVGSSTTIFTFPTGLPNAGYVDIYSPSGDMLYAGTDYTLNFLSGNWTVVFAVAPGTGPLAVFTPDIFDDRNQYALSPVADGTTTQFGIVGGTPEGSVDVFVAGLFQVSSAAALGLSAGEWVIVFTTAPTSGSSMWVVF